MSASTCFSCPLISLPIKHEGNSSTPSFPLVRSSTVSSHTLAQRFPFHSLNTDSYLFSNTMNQDNEKFVVEEDDEFEEFDRERA